MIKSPEQQLHEARVIVREELLKETNIDAKELFVNLQNLRLLGISMVHYDVMSLIALAVALGGNDV
jgi:hypothetical protein